jgi:hypothetical protein
MSDLDPNAIENHAATAKTVVDHLISIASGEESDEWLARYLAIQQALAGGKFKEALRENCRLGNSSTVNPTWVVSRDLAKLVTRALGNLAFELKLVNPGKTEIRLDDLPSDVYELGTVTEENQTKWEALLKQVKRDPLETDARYMEFLAAASNQAEAELADHPMNGGIGFCHVLWKKKKEILRERYGLEWQTPAELNPDIKFD